ncbi:MAG: type II toxin-antitoxin system RelE/ParE family toxin [Methanocalculus sp. MSAO_Arc2]|uniref:type II toxin-antitoxin system RelE family toxin n=1 Tax=Methanocalculus sp. MSAO_Arc2 TaxID=2293855 RepID=UPI000FF70BD6|nr:MAG: type II toxin-antitoxin system RelE/ParE family toxin [Methanocalculus sp. MSAO_Arc2]
MKPFDIVIIPPAERDLARLDPPSAQRIQKALGDLANEENPNWFLKRLEGDHDPTFFSLRIGEYRAILKIHNGRLIIVVVEV